MSSNNENKPDLRLTPRVRELLDLETQFTVGGFEPMPYFFDKARGSLLWVSEEETYESRK
jgi:ornithine--oxo-acid transaminase